jgi:gamma-glutamylcyclotransferase (GGCT)/AIG2-like uncharacterized protein YtfP
MTHLFVYGSLVPDRDAWPVLASWAVGTPNVDAVIGRLYDTGRGYPAATFGADAHGLVHGAVVELDAERAAAALVALDQYEADDYERIVVRTVGGTSAYAYEWRAPLDRFALLPDGRWCGRSGARDGEAREP